MSSLKKQIATNTLTGWLAMGCRMAIALALVPLLIGELGKDGFGLIGLMGVIVGLSFIVDLGLRQALGRELSEKVARHDVEGFRQLSFTALVLYLVMAGVLAAALWFAAPWFVDMFNVSEAWREQGITLIRLYGGGALILSFVSPVLHAGLQSFMRFDAVNWAQTATSITSGLLLLSFVGRTGFNPLATWACIMLGAQLLDVVILWLLYRRFCYDGQLARSNFKVNTVIPLLKLGGYMYVIQLANTISERADPLVVSFFFGPAGVALYHSGSRLSMMMRPIILTLSTQIHPLTTRYHVKKETQNQHKVLTLGTRYTMYPGVLVCTGILLFAEPFCRLWLYEVLGADYRTVVQIMRLYALADLADYAAGMHWPTILGMKKMRFALWVMIPSSLFNIAASIYLVGYSGMGIPGVLIATIATCLIRRPIIIVYLARQLNLSIKDIVLSSYVRPVIVLVFLILYHYPLNMTPPLTWFTLVAHGAVFSLYGALLTLAAEWALVKQIVLNFKQRRVL